MRGPTSGVIEWRLVPKLTLHIHCQVFSAECECTGQPTVIMPGSQAVHIKMSSCNPITIFCAISLSDDIIGCEIAATGDSRSSWRDNVSASQLVKSRYYKCISRHPQRTWDR